jgi:hypothetical protein
MDHQPMPLLEPMKNIEQLEPNFRRNSRYKRLGFFESIPKATS